MYVLYTYVICVAVSFVGSCLYPQLPANRGTFPVPLPVHEFQLPLVEPHQRRPLRDGHHRYIVPFPRRRHFVQMLLHVH